MWSVAAGGEVTMRTEEREGEEQGGEGVAAVV